MPKVAKTFKLEQSVIHAIEELAKDRTLVSVVENAIVSQAILNLPKDRFWEIFGEDIRTGRLYFINTSDSSRVDLEKLVDSRKIQSPE